MDEALYGELAGWWSVLSPPSDYSEEAEQILRWLGPVGSILELGSGGGHLASWFPEDADVVLVDSSAAMLDASRALNPRRRHVCASMEDLELGRTFDAVVLHDAVMYLLDERSLQAAFDSAARHLRPGGRLVVLPDFVEDGFEEHLVSGSREDGDRAVAMTEWHWDPDPDDGTVRVDFAFLLRDGTTMRAVHDVHTMALHPRERVWRCLLAAGFEPLEVPLDDLREEGEVFLVRRVHDR